MNIIKGTPSLALTLRLCTSDLQYSPNLIPKLIQIFYDCKLKHCNCSFQHGTNNAEHIMNNVKVGIIIM